MMHLGTLIARLSDQTVAEEALLSLGDLAMVANADRLANHFEETLGEYAAGSVRRFAQLASDEDWLALVTALERGDDPGMTCLKQMVTWSVREDDKALQAPHHAHSGGCHGCHPGS